MAGPSDDDPSDGWMSAEQQAQWAEHQRLEAVTGALKRRQRGVHLTAFQPRPDQGEPTVGHSSSTGPELEHELRRIRAGWRALGNWPAPEGNDARHRGEGRGYKLEKPQA